MTDLIRKSDALERFPDGRQPWSPRAIRSAIAALPAVTLGVKPLVWQHEARNGWKVGVAWTTGYHIIRRDDGWHYGNGAGGIFPTIEAAKAAAQADYTARILAALTPTAVDDSQPADPAVNAPDYSLAPHLQRIVEAAKTTPQWDTMSDRMTAHDLTEYERKVAQMKEDFPNGI